MIYLGFIFVLFLKAKADSEIFPTVVIELGKLQGKYKTSVEGRKYASFEGVPYAQPPIENYRLQDANPVRPWNGVWIADTVHKCLQYDQTLKISDSYGVDGDEDCLHLNIYTPNLNKEKNLDVVVFIHGGAFMFGQGSGFTPEIIMDKDVVYVNLNYRLGILGFLSSEDNVIPGNFGLKDQLLALKWIKKHIRSFGGNPESITLSGMSAGGASAHILYLSPLSKDLFQRGISQSGTALNPWVLVENAREKAKRVANYLGCPTENSNEILDCLRSRPARKIVAITENFLGWYYNPFSPFGVVIDKWSDNPILPEHPLKILKKGNLKSIPWIFSMTESEGLYPGAEFIGNPKAIEELNEKWEQLLPFLLDFNNTISSQDLASVSRRIRDYYFKYQSVSMDTFPILIKMIGDRLFGVDIEMSAKLQSANTDSSVYFYYFAYRGTHSRSELFAGQNIDYGAGHGDDTIFLLTPTMQQETCTETDKRMTKLMKDLWTSFANTGKPTIENVNWIPLSKNENTQLIFLKISSPDDVKIETTEDIANANFWNTIKFNENLKLFHERDEL